MSSNTPRRRRVACLICRQRKVKCDGVQPSCARCARFGDRCVYLVTGKETTARDAAGQGGTREFAARMSREEGVGGILKDMRSRLHQVESLLYRLPGLTETENNGFGSINSNHVPLSPPGLREEDDSDKRSIQAGPHPYWDSTAVENSMFAPASQSTEITWWDPLAFQSSVIAESPARNSPSRTSLLKEHRTRPGEDLIQENWEEIFFKEVHPCLPMIDRKGLRERIISASDLGYPSLELTCLCSAIKMAAAIEHPTARDRMYQQAREDLDRLELDPSLGNMKSLEAVQTWTLVAVYELKHMLVPVAWMSIKRAARLAHLLGLHQLDIESSDMAAIQDWTVIEEKRRTFWALFAVDRYLSTGTGWGPAVLELGITTKLPSLDYDCSSNAPPPTISFGDALENPASVLLWPFAGVIITSDIWERLLRHAVYSRNELVGVLPDASYEFWLEHYNLDKIIVNTMRCLTHSLRMQQRSPDPNTVFSTVNSLSAVIVLHDIAMSVTRRSSIAENITADSKARCLKAATEIASIMSAVYSSKAHTKNCFLVYSLYTGAKYFGQHLEENPNDVVARDSQSVLCTVLGQMRLKTPLAQIFIDLVHMETGVGRPRTLSTKDILPFVSFSFAGTGAESVKLDAIPGYQ